jgi:hypothetical protein
MRRPKTYVKGNCIGAGKIKDMVMVSERLAEVKDRAVPGHWEGDLIFGKTMTSIGTLVERHNGYVMLLKLPNVHNAAAVRKVMTKRVLTLPTQLRRSITWDHGCEMAQKSSSQSTPECRSTSAIPGAPGSAAATRTPTVCSANTRPSPQIFRSAVNETRCHRPLAQYEASTDTRMDNTISGVRRGCCVGDTVLGV